MATLITNIFGIGAMNAADVTFTIEKMFLNSWAFLSDTLEKRKYTAKVGQDNVNIGVVTIFRLANISLLQVYLMDKCLLQDLYIYRK